MDNQLAIFEQKPILKVEYNGEMYFSIVDIIPILTDSTSPKTYWAKLKKKLTEESGSEVFPNLELLKMMAADGKSYKTDKDNNQYLIH
jgi:DNA-damage-inducible protein D